MPIAVKCSSCSSRFKAPDKAAGKKVNCPKCSNVIKIPDPSRKPTREEVQTETTNQATDTQKATANHSVRSENGDYDAQKIGVIHCLNGGTVCALLILQSRLLLLQQKVSLMGFFVGGFAGAAFSTNAAKKRIRAFCELPVQEIEVLDECTDIPYHNISSCEMKKGLVGYSLKIEASSGTTSYRILGKDGTTLLKKGEVEEYQSYANAMTKLVSQ